MARAASDIRCALIGLGSNLDDPVAQARSGLSALGRIPGSRLLAHSRLWRTPPWGEPDQPDFINAVAELETRLDAPALLAALLAIEEQHGRRREGARWGPRTLDLDLLDHGGQRLDLPGLQLPHPRLATRAFVLLPLAELGEERVVAGLGRVCDLVQRVDSAGCRPLSDSSTWRAAAA